MACHCRNGLQIQPFEHKIRTEWSGRIYCSFHYGRGGFNDEVIAWLDSDDAHGYFTAEDGWVDYVDGREEFILKMSFTDADTAFAFKMRFC